MDRWSGEISFTVAPDLNLPTKLYTTEEDSKFVDKVLSRYKIMESGTLGVMLSGLKGSGKTVMMKNLAVKSNLPILLIDKSFAPSQLVNLFNKLSKIELCVLMDEIDKIGENYDDDYLLKILDGVNTTGKKLMIFTCNDAEDINEYLQDRCSRIRYWREFDVMPSSMIQNILSDKLKDKNEVKPLTDFIIENFGVVSFDNVISFVDEVNENTNDTYEDLFNDMNLSSK
jgi:Cdc6-like AAA superfamily ATPase